ncbi:DUF5347 family protein [Pluralibacter gergoviae]|uniref:DUF5347 family protein n=1 Tax=Pluralibacter gergoviae TaxID=61647 RepID=UPI000A368C3B|nr:DUF5347 family protein [Pluralibacter gergoviae]EKT9643344.1 DUF5347 family protein [Pluralibacter gergoviae]EKV3544289.1 DUF5347 family protein [Pluralibacter gergoviae]EKV9899191.1 DUF5347 family protein [Pluralibacter gergoviae]EKV9933319.1 DUF5347 family protein [Pluralibacter gergoviae]EKW9977039.1 DUF5347 family protein [Pluralibacter gergoviae]
MPVQIAPSAGHLNVGQRPRGLDQISKLRAQYWDEDGKALRAFFAAMQNRRDPEYSRNVRALSALLFLAGIPAGRHALPLESLSTAERTALIHAMNQFRAMVSLFPGRLSLPR